MTRWHSLIIDLSSQTCQMLAEPEYPVLGGRGLTSGYLYDHMDPATDALGAGNTIILATGLAAGSNASSSNRLSIGAKSPLTGGIKESNIGGSSGYALAKLGIRSLVLTGQSTDWQVLHVSINGICFHPADELVGLGIYPAVDALRQRFGRQVAVLAIGQAGELLLPAALIGGTDMDGVPGRQAARGGLGAVLGSKRIKAIVIDPAGGKFPEPADKHALLEAVRAFAAALQANPATGQSLPKYGTAVFVSTINAVGGLPTRSFTAGAFEDAEKISGDALYELISGRGGKPTHACMPGCVIRCSNVLPGPDGAELTRGFEYETIGLLGSNCGINDLDQIAALNYACDDVGLDTIEIGAAAGAAMQTGVLRFGDAASLLSALQLIPHEDGLGRLFGRGAAETGRRLGISRIPAVKGQAMSAYDPRAFKGTAVTYATSPMGADHTAGNAIPGTRLPDGRRPSPSSPVDQVELSAYLQDLACAFDSLGLCWFARGPILVNNALVLNILSALHGGEWTFKGLLEQGRKTILEEEAFNEKAGLENDSDLPAFFREEPLSPNGLVFDVPIDQMREIRRAT